METFSCGWVEIELLMFGDQLFSVRMYKRYICTLIHVFVSISNILGVERLWDTDRP